MGEEIRVPEITSDPEFQVWSKLPGDGDYRIVDTWPDAGLCSLDKKLTKLADLYLRLDATKQRQIREFFEGRFDRLDEMWVYVRRVAKLIRSKRDVEWLRRGLAIAAIEGGRMDYRDSIVSLVILRYGAERVGIETSSFFNEAINIANPESRMIFENARDHSEYNIKFTVKEMGPSDWAAELQRD